MTATSSPCAAGACSCAISAGRPTTVRSIADTEIEGCIRRCLALGMTIDEVTLRMMDVTHRLKDEKS